MSYNFKIYAYAMVMGWVAEEIDSPWWLTAWILAVLGTAVLIGAAEGVRCARQRHGERNHPERIRR